MPDNLEDPRWSQCTFKKNKQQWLDARIQSEITLFRVQSTGWQVHRFIYSASSLQRKQSGITQRIAGLYWPVEAMSTIVSRFIFFFFSFYMTEIRHLLRSKKPFDKFLHYYSKPTASGSACLTTNHEVAGSIPGKWCS